MPPSSAILDTAFKTAYKATPHGETRLERAKRRALLKVIRSGSVVTRHLRLALRAVEHPELTEFDIALIDRSFGAGQRERAHRRLVHAMERIRGISVEEQRAIRQARETDEYAVSVRRFYGRLASFTREVDPDLRLLAEIAKFRRQRPRLDPLVPTVVVAGFPNVGKSSLVAKLSSANPRVASYPFTTVALEVGHADVGFDRWQVLDTPGVLNRGRAMNAPEIEADAAVSRAATIVLFVIDPSGSCGFPVEDQERLLARWQRELPNARILVVETKADLAVRAGARLTVSATTGEGLEALREEIERMLREIPDRPSREPAIRE